MSMFSALGTSYSGMTFHKTWIDATADNVANINTVRRSDQPAFAAKYVIASAVPGQGGIGQQGIGAGVAVGGVALGDEEGKLVFSPDHPLADDEGMVRYPSVELGDQMTNLIIAQRAYDANVKAFESARDAYRRALQIGKS